MSSCNVETLTMERLIEKWRQAVSVFACDYIDLWLTEHIIRSWITLAITREVKGNARKVTAAKWINLKRLKCLMSLIIVALKRLNMNHWVETAAGRY